MYKEHCSGPSTVFAKVPRNLNTDPTQPVLSERTGRSPHIKKRTATAADGAKRMGRESDEKGKEGRGTFNARSHAGSASGPRFEIHANFINTQKCRFMGTQLVRPICMTKKLSQEV